jgi:hypothetical protein
MMDRCDVEEQKGRGQAETQILKACSTDRRLT